MDKASKEFYAYRTRGRTWKGLVLVYIWISIVGVMNFYKYLTFSFLPSASNNTIVSKKRLILSDLYKIQNHKHKNYSEFWRTVRNQIQGDYLYPRDFDANLVVTALRQAKILHADLFKVPNSIKFKLVLEGGQTAIFKLMNIEKHNKSGQTCNTGCEHPEYEMVAFTLNRLFDLRNMPYAAGRILSWADDLEPVATSELKNFIYVEDDQSICFDWECLRIQSSRYCFQNGQIPGAVIYFIEDKILKSFKLKDQHSKYHEFYELGARQKSDLERLPGDKTFCKKFRQSGLYKNDSWFLDIVDMAVIDYLMSHMDSRHFYISETGKDKKPMFNVMFDYGRAFCQTHHIHALAPLIQCCRIRTRLFNAMAEYSDTLEEALVSSTEDDPLHPLLLPELMEDMISKFKQTLALIDFCRHLDGDSNVLIDL